MEDELIHVNEFDEMSVWSVADLFKYKDGIGGSV